MPFSKMDILTVSESWTTYTSLFNRLTTKNKSFVSQKGSFKCKNSRFEDLKWSKKANKKIFAVACKKWWEGLTRTIFWVGKSDEIYFASVNVSKQRKTAPSLILHYLGIWKWFGGVCKANRLILDLKNWGKDLYLRISPVVFSSWNSISWCMQAM